jgi:hypothetical protein
MLPPFWRRRLSTAVCLLGLLSDPEDGGCVFLSKHRKTSTGLQSITSEKTVFVIVTTMRTTNSTSLMLIGFLTYLLRKVQSKYQNTTILIRKVIVYNNSPIEIKEGVLQGCPLSRVLFNIYIDEGITN